MTNPLEEKFLAVADSGDHWTKSTILQLATEELVKEETHPRLEEFRKHFDWEVDYGVNATLEFDIARLALKKAKDYLIGFHYGILKQLFSKLLNGTKTFANSKSLQRIAV